MASVFARLRLGAFGLAVVLCLTAAAGPARADQTPVAQVCASLLPGFAHCDAEVALASHAAVRKSSAVPSGYGPADLQSAYDLTSVAAAYGSDQTVAVVDAYDAPNAERDLAVYRAQFGLAPCTSADGCFRKVNQNGGSTPPAPDSGWASEIALDLDMVSAVCPHCRILLVEANTNSASDLAAAVDQAAAMGATQISNSYGYAETAGVAAYEPYYRHPGIGVTVASGDSGYGVEYPASSAYVTAVGGTSLMRSATPRGWSETAWSGSGSGCSTQIPKPAWQTDSSCAMRSVADVSAVADPNTGVAVYDSGTYGWQVYGGTSAAAPVVAAAYALTGASAASDFGAYAYQNPGYFNDITSGSNAASCTFLYLCTAGAGFDGPTGMGSPDSAHPTGPAPPIVESGTTPPTSGQSGTSSAGPITGDTGAPPERSKSVAPPLRSSVAVSAAAVAASRRGVLAIRVSCARGRPACKGVFTLQARISHRALRTLARRSYSLRPGKSVLLKLRLSSRYRRLLERTRRLRAYGTARDSDGTKGQAALVLRARISRS